jgi:hypothetical protein
MIADLIFTAMLFLAAFGAGWELARYRRNTR